MSSAADSQPSSVVGELADLGAILAEYREPLLEMLQRRIRRGDVTLDAEDILQDACIVAHRRWSEFVARRAAEPKVSAYVWLYGLTRDRLIDHWRAATCGIRDERRNVAWPDRSSEQLGMHLFRSGGGPLSAAVREELKQRVAQALELLPNADHEIIRLRQLRELSFGEIAEALNITQNAATVRYVRALQRLKVICEALFADYGDEQ